MPARLLLTYMALERAIAEQLRRAAAQAATVAALDQCIKPPPAPAVATSA